MAKKLFSVRVTLVEKLDYHVMAETEAEARALFEAGEFADVAVETRDEKVESVKVVSPDL